VIWWKTILVHGPTIVDTARKLYAATRRTADPEAAALEGGEGIDGLRRAVDSLAARETEHSALLADLAKQVQDIATIVDVLRVRVMLALLGSALALALALVAVAVRVWR
jgi:hypothetical protein